jgi:hypothetical protein
MVWKTIEEFSKSRETHLDGLSLTIQNEIVERRKSSPRPQPPTGPKGKKTKMLKHSCFFVTSNFEKKPAKRELLVGENSPEDLAYR